MSDIEVTAPDLPTLQNAGKAVKAYVQDEDGNWMWRDGGLIAAPDGNTYPWAMIGPYQKDGDTNWYCLFRWPPEVPQPDPTGLGVTIGDPTPGGPVFA